MSQAQGQHRDLIQSIEGLPAAPGLSPLDQDLLMLKATSMATMNCLNECLHILHLQQVARQRGSLGGQLRAVPAWLMPHRHLFALWPVTLATRCSRALPVFSEREYFCNQTPQIKCLCPRNKLLHMQDVRGGDGQFVFGRTVELFCIIDEEPYLFLPPVLEVIRSQMVKISISSTEGRFTRLRAAA